jgi:hypothetical protein
MRVDRQRAGTYIGEMVSAEDNSNDLGHGPDVDKLVLATVNAPYKRDIAAPRLAECLLKADAGDWLVHVATFFTDVRPAVVLAFAASHGISRSKLASAYFAIKTETGERNLDLETVLGSMAMAEKAGSATNLFEQIRSHVEPLGGVELKVPRRRSVRERPTFDD